MALPLCGGDEVNALVLDVGSYQCKAGYAGEDTPKVLMYTAVGEVPEEHRSAAAPMDVDPPSTSQENSPAQGSAANNGKPEKATPKWKTRGLRPLRAPHVRPLDHQVVHQTMRDSVVTDWDLWEAVVDDAVRQKLRTDPTTHPMLLSEPSNVSKDQRERCAERIFESFQAPAMFLAKNAVLSSFALGRQTSVVLDIGYDGATVAAVHDGYVLNASVMRSPVGGRLLSECMRKSLASKSIALHPWYLYSHASKASGAGTETVIKERGNVSDSHMAWATEFLASDIKESHCRMNEQPFVEEENLNMPMQSYELPDGSSIDIGVERFKIPEILFNPAVMQAIPGMRTVSGPGGQPLVSVAQMVIDSVNATDVDLRKELFAGVVLTGGSSLFMSTKERLDRELLELAPQAAKVRVTTHQNATERRFSVWLGGSILGSLGSFHQLWMSKQEYDEHGPGLIHRRSP